MKWIVAVLVLLAGCSSPSSEPIEASAFQIVHDPYLGNPNADVIVIAFEAPACINCKIFHNGAFQELNATYFQTGKAGFYAKQWTVGYPYDEVAGIALECVYAQGGNEPYFSLMHRIYNGASDRGGLEAAIFRVADLYELDINAVFGCYDNPELESHQIAQGHMQMDITIGIQQGATSSPAFFILTSDGTEYLGGSATKLADRLEALT